MSTRTVVSRDLAPGCGKTIFTPVFSRESEVYFRVLFFVKLCFTFLTASLGFPLLPKEVFGEKASHTSSRPGGGVLLRRQNRALGILHPDWLRHLLQQLVNC
jgi:hypothetical protein